MNNFASVGKYYWDVFNVYETLTKFKDKLEASDQEACSETIRLLQIVVDNILNIYRYIGRIHNLVPPDIEEYYRNFIEVYEDHVLAATSSCYKNLCDTNKYTCYMYHTDPLVAHHHSFEKTRDLVDMAIDSLSKLNHSYLKQIIRNLR